MVKRKQPRDYISREVVVIQATDKAILVQADPMGPKAWIAKLCIIKFELIEKSKPEHCNGLYKITAQRYVFTRAGL